jgi:hypothetical protein
MQRRGPGQAWFTEAPLISYENNTNHWITKEGFVSLAWWDNNLRKIAGRNDNLSEKSPSLHDLIDHFISFEPKKYI